jgi:predicted PurR-regulated permease PerM
MLGQLCSMALVGTLTGVGLWMLGVPLAFLIGILAGILDFVPIVGTIVSGIPAVLLAFLNSPLTAFYVVLLYIGIHQIEAHLIMPLIQQRAIALPPVITIVALVLFERVFGFMGLLLAAPIAATIMVLVKAIYVEDLLGDDALESPLRNQKGKENNR